VNAALQEPGFSALEPDKHIQTKIARSRPLFITIKLDG
jgi:hypothetical protein